MRRRERDFSLALSSLSLFLHATSARPSFCSAYPSEGWQEMVGSAAPVRATMAASGEAATPLGMMAETTWRDGKITSPAAEK